MQTQLQQDLFSLPQASNDGNVTVKVLRHVEDVERLRPFWSSCAGARDSDMDICFATQRGNPDILRPHVLVLYRGETPNAILIGRIVRRRLPFRVGYFSLFNPLVNVMTFPYGGLRGNSCQENCKILVGEVVKSLRNGESDVALLEHVRTDSPLFHSAQSAPGLLFREHFLRVRPHRKRELPATIEELNESVSASERKRFRQISKKLNTDFPGQVRIVKFDQPSELSLLIEDVEKVTSRTWQRKLGSGFNANQSLLNFFKTEAENGWLRSYVLYLENRPCAFWVGAIYQGTFYSDFTGYDPEYAQYSLGTFLLWQMMEQFSTQGVRAIDFGFSDEEYKKRFANVSWRESSLHVFAPTGKGLSLNIRKVIATLLHEPTRAFLERTNLIQKAKKTWRKLGGSAQH